MLYHLLYPLHQDYAALNVFRYITFRAAYAALTALAMSLLLGPWVIRTLAAWRFGQQIRAEGPESHQGKAGTPTMGGLLILFCVTVPTLLWGRLDNLYLWLALLTTLAFGAVGFADDWFKIARRRSLGLSGRWKLAAQVADLGRVRAGARRRSPRRSSRRASASRSSRTCCSTSAGSTCRSSSSCSPGPRTP